MISQIEPIVTVADLDCMPDDGSRYEVIEGELFVSRAPSLTHQLIITNLITRFRYYLDLNPIGIVVPGPGVIFSDNSGVIPDLVFIGNQRRQEIASGERITGAPDLVIEIVSPGVENDRRDRVAKRQLYGKYGVKEYWIVDPENRAIEVYLLQGRTLKLAARFQEADEITCSVLSGFVCQVEHIFAL